MLSRNKLFLLLVLACFGLLLTAHPAAAQITELEIDTTLQCTGGVPSGELFTNRNAPSGSTVDMCGRSLDNDHIFARVMCIFESALGEIIANIFCAVQDGYLEGFSAMLLLCMAATAVLFVIGVLDFTAKELIMVLFKFGLVICFAMYTDFVIQITYRFFVGAARFPAELFGAFSGFDRGPDPVTGVAPTGDPTDADGMITYFRERLGDQADPVYCKAGWLGLLFTLALFAPLVFGIWLFGLISAIELFVRGLVGYLYALTLLTFLIALSPIFVSFALFRSTADLFNNWLKYLGSNVIQIGVIFALIWFANRIDILHWLTSLSAIGRPWHFEFSLLAWKFKPFSFGCSICEGIVVPPIDRLFDELQCPAGAAGMAPWNLLQQRELGLYLVAKGAAFLIITRIMGEMMKAAPEMAKQLGGAAYVQSLTGVSDRFKSEGYTGQVNAPGMAALSKAPDGFLTGYFAGIGYRNPLSRAISGLREAGMTVLYGERLRGEEELRYSHRNEELLRYQVQRDQRRLIKAQERSDAAERNLRMQQDLMSSGRGSAPELAKAFLAVNIANRDVIKARQVIEATDRHVNDIAARRGGLYSELWSDDDEAYSKAQRERGAWHSLLSPSHRQPNRRGNNSGNNSGNPI